MKSNPTTSIYLDTRHQKKDNSYPVKLRVCFERKAKFYHAKFNNVNLYLSKEDFDIIMESAKPRGLHKDIKFELVDIEDRAMDIIEALPQFNFASFEKKFLGPTQTKADIFSYYKDYIATLEKNNQFGTASSYHCSMTSIHKFLTLKYEFTSPSFPDAITPFPFFNITSSFLQEYENYMIEENNSSPSTVGVYMRPLRALFKIAIDNGEISNENYPFGIRKYQIPTTTSHKRPVENQDMKKLLHTPADENEEKARDFWFLSYLCNGVNNRDLLEIKYDVNLQKDQIVFLREKTKRTNKNNAKTIIIPLIAESIRIIDKYKNPDDRKGKYVFPTLNEGMSHKERWKAVQNFNRFVGQHIKTLAKKAGIDPGISAIWARHTFATTMRDNGSNDELISESLGHSNVKTTTNYLNGFKMTKKKEFANKLMNFNND